MSSKLSGKITNMKEIGIWGIVLIFVSGLLFSCAHKITPEDINKKLEPEFLNKKLDTKKIDLSINGKCPGTRSLNVINVETSSERRTLWVDRQPFMPPTTYYIIPIEFTDAIVRYIKELFIEGNLIIDEELGKKIFVSLCISSKGCGQIEHKNKRGFQVPNSFFLFVKQPLMNNYSSYVGPSFLS